MRERTPATKRRGMTLSLANSRPPCQASPDQLKKAFVDAPVLQIFNPKLHSHLFVNTSDKAIAAALMQQPTNISLCGLLQQKIEPGTDELFRT